MAVDRFPSVCKGHVKPRWGTVWAPGPWFCCLYLGTLQVDSVWLVTAFHAMKGGDVARELRMTQAGLGQMDMTPETGMERRKLEDMMQAASLRLIEVAKELQEKDAKVRGSGPA